MNHPDDEETVAPLRRDVFYKSSDGLSLHVADYGDVNTPWLPVVCLSGLSRNCRDFERLALHLSTHRHRPRRVVAFDYRGRGRSEWDPDTSHYNPLTEMNDVLDGMTTLGIDRAVIVGTSRGGIIAMMIGVARPNALAGLVLNDIGPVIEPLGLARIKARIGRTPAPDNWSDAIAIQKRLHEAQFPGLSDSDWDAFVRMTYRDEDGQPANDYHPALSETLDGIEFDSPIPSLWNEFNALGDVPILAIRGEHSDILSAETLAEMAASHSRFASVTIDGQGHAPLLLRTAVLQRISAFITNLEGSGPPIDAVVPRDAPAFDLETQDDIPPSDDA
ncbi:alpha/beta fold hydrolase [Bauldia sp.]|uniref:alpha/beta fold hydrolase n=1 Tax=Bauldia sp. TaxID=2575872 RepID=UPI003BAA5EE6